MPINRVPCGRRRKRPVGLSASPAFRSAALSTSPAEVFFGLWRADLRLAFVGLPSPPRSLGSSVCSLNDPSDPTGRLRNEARLRHGRGDDVRIVALLRRTLVKEIAVC